MLIDTNTLLRTLQVRHPQYETGEPCYRDTPGPRIHAAIVPQNLFELWVVATRPHSQNGLGLSVADAFSELTRIKAMFSLLPDTPTIYPVWEELVTRNQVSGKPAHDARLVAAMLVHGVTSVLTFDRAGFSRYAEIEVVHPTDLVLMYPGDVPIRPAPAPKLLYELTVRLKARARRFDWQFGQNFLQVGVSCFELNFGASRRNPPMFSFRPSGQAVAR